MATIKLEYKWIRFEEVSDKHPSRKTRTFCCYNKSNILLGTVQWDSGWRGYIFVTFTDAYDELKFSKSCLDDMSSFIGQLVEDEKYAKGNDMTAEEENLKHTKPCRVDGVTPCVQYPEEDPCDCDWCDDCPVSLEFKKSQRK